MCHSYARCFFAYPHPDDGVSVVDLWGMQHKQTKVATGEQAKKYILEGVNAVYLPVRRTLGPKGGNALLYGTYGQSPRITNDGVTIAETIEPKNEFSNLVATSFKEACKRTNERAGDATTTTTVIAGCAMNDILGSDSASIFGNNQNDMMQKRIEILDVVKKVEEKIKERAVKIESLADLEKVAAVSVQDETIGKLVASIVYAAGTDGFVDVQEGFKGIIEHEIIEGMRFPAKVAHKGFVNNEARYEMVMEDVPVLVTNHACDNVGEIGDSINKLFGVIGTRKIAILAPSFSDQVLIEFAKAIKNNYFIYPVKVPSLRTEQFEDVCAYFDATFINKDSGRTIGTATQADLGFVGKLIVKDVEAREDAIATGGRGSKSDAIKERIEALRKSIAETKVPTHKALIERRIASLASAVAVIRVGASTDAETRYLKLKIDDAVYACKGALEEGYVRGAGICLNEIADELGDTVFTNALRAPYEYIKNMLGGESVHDSVIDNAKAVRLAVVHAGSVVAHLITTEIIVAEVRDASPVEGYREIAEAILITNKKDANGNTSSDIEGQYDRMLEEFRMDN